MSREAAIQELEGSPETSQSDATPAPVATPPTSPQEELEILLNGNPFKLPTNVEIPIKHNGQILKQPLSNLLNSYRQGTHIEEKLKEYRTLKEQLEAERGDMDQFRGMKEKYGAIQDWSEKNPEDWQRLWDSFQNKEKVLLGGNGGGETGQYLEHIAALKKELASMKEWQSGFEREREEVKLQQETKALQEEVEAFKKEWPEIDLDEKNLDGVSLRGQIMNHGLQKGVGEFGLAAMSFLKPRLLEIAAFRGRTEAVKGVKTDKQQGIVARSSTPFNGQSSEGDPNKMSKVDRAAAAKAELERMLSGTG